MQWLKSWCPSSDWEWGCGKSKRIIWLVWTQALWSWFYDQLVSLALQKSCAPGTSKVLCTWHYKNVLIYAHHVSKVHNVDLQTISGGVWSHISIQASSPSQDGMHSFCPLLGVVSLLSFPLVIGSIVSPLTTTSHDVNWAESSSNTHNCRDA